MKKLLNTGWKFAKLEPLTDIEQARLRMEEFKEVKLPHDFAIEKFETFYEDAAGWYFKEVDIKPQKNNRILLYFDSVYMDCNVYLNGEMVYEWKYGYTPFEVDITDKVMNGKNEIAVCVNYNNPNSRWYSGAGIERNVWLDIVPLTYIPRHGIYANSIKIDDTNDWQLIVDIHVRDYSDIGTENLENARNLDLFCELMEGEEPVSGLVETSHECIHKTQNTCTFRKEYIVHNPKVWDIDEPNVYTIRAGIKGFTAEEWNVEESIIGFRTIDFSADKGFFINGRNIKLNGVCEHHDFGMIGAGFYEDAMERKIITLKNMGVNAIRFSHNPVDEKVLELCDRLGVLAISEAFDMWESPKTEYDYARFFRDWYERDVRAWVRQDRNHPCLIMWSLGNEIYDLHLGENGRRILNDLAREVRRYDPLHNAYITFASNYMPWENAQKAACDVEVVGYNYAERCYEEHHREHPDWVIYGSETASIVYSRGVYRFPLEVAAMTDDDMQCSALGNSATSWGASSFEKCACFDRDLEYSAGQFIWTGFDYLGEPTPYHTKNSYFGQIDTAGFPKTSYYMWQSVWIDRKVMPVIYLSPNWDYNQGQIVDVRVMSNAAEVELFVNEKSLGRQVLNHEPGSGYKVIADYKVPFEKGKIMAIGYDEKGTQIASFMRKTSKDTHSLICREIEYSLYGNDYKLGRYKSYDEDLIFYEILALDEDGNEVENASDLVKVKVLGDGELLALDNGDSTDYTEQKAASKRLFNGRLLLVVRKTGKGEVKSVVERDTSIIPVRRIDLECQDCLSFTKEKNKSRIKVNILPYDASDKSVIFKITDLLGNESSIASITSIDYLTDGSIEIEAKGDGRFKLRAFSKSSTDEIRVISELMFEAKGLGSAYRDPYGFIAGSSFDSCIGANANGNERGAATRRGAESVLIYENIDFGLRGSKEITLPIFSLDNDKKIIEIYDGKWGSDDVELICTGVYDHVSIWNVYQEDTYYFERPLKGIHTLSIRTTEKVHIKGFSCKEYNSAFEEQWANRAERIYGDSYKITDSAVERIGNNVTIDFGQMDFGEKGAKTITVCGKSNKEHNTIHLRFAGQSVESKNILEFEKDEDYVTRVFEVKDIRNLGKIELVFLPGCDFDLKWIKFGGRL